MWRGLGWWGWIALWIRGQALTQGEIRRLCYPWEVATALSARGVTGQKCPSQTGAIKTHLLGASGKERREISNFMGAILKPKQIELFFQVSWTFAHLCKFEIVLWGSELGWTEWRSWKPLQNETRRIRKGMTWYISDSQDRSVCC